VKRPILLILTIALATAAWAQPKVAVFDAAIPADMDTAVVIPMTEKIIERLAASGRFAVLDREDIERLLKRRDFKLPRTLSDADAAEAGEYLGADYVVVAKAQEIGDTYYVSSKMIAVKTGVVANRTSAQAEGKLSTLLSLAEQVGDALSGGGALVRSAGVGNLDNSTQDARNAASAPAKTVPQKGTQAPVGDAKPKKTWPLWLNLAPGYGVGSFVQGDKAGGLTGLIGCIAGDILIIAGYSSYNAGYYDAYYSDSGTDSGVAIMVAGEAILIGTCIYGIVRPINYAKQWNREHGFASVDIAPTLSMTNSSGGVAVAPGAVMRLSY
jgi:hypothetical protein